MTDGQGFIRRSKIYAGNISEPSTLREVISELAPDSTGDAGLFASRPVAVTDAGMVGEQCRTIATEENLEYLRNNGFDYICVSRSGLQDYSLAETGCKTVFDNRKHPIEICSVIERSRNIATPEEKTEKKAKCKTEDKAEGDLYLYVKSGMKRQKEQSMSGKLTGRFVAELEKIRSSLSRKRGIKQEGAVNQRIGRLRQKYTSVSKLYTIELKTDENKTVTDIIYSQSKPAAEAGVYFIRSSQNQLTEELIW